MVATIDILGRRIGPGLPPFIIAEVGVNHNGSAEMANQLVEAAAAAGADAVKFQSFRAGKLVTRAAYKAEYQERFGGSGSQYDMLKPLELSNHVVANLKKAAERLGLVFMSSPFDRESAAFLDSIGVPAFKLGSGELTNSPLLEYVGGFGKPVILSTGMAGTAEVEAAIEVVKKAGNEQIALLHCVSNYPANPKDANLKAISTMNRKFGVPVGYSDHCPGILISLAAAALGACIVEKHFTLDKDLPGPDHRSSLDRIELKQLVEGVRLVAGALGTGIKAPVLAEKPIAELTRKSVVATVLIPKGTKITGAMLTVKRPATGIPPGDLAGLVGAVAARDIQADETIKWEDVLT